MSIEEDLNVTIARGKIYMLLATLFKNTPDQETAELVLSEEFRHIANSSGVELEPREAVVVDEACLEELSTEFTKLFVGPGPHLSPHESVQRELPDGKWGTLWGDSAVAVNQFYESVGLKLPDEEKRLPDNLSLEFEFMSMLLAEEEELMNNSANSEEVDKIRSTQQAFLKEHLLSWVPRFMERVIETSESNFFIDVAQLTKNFLQSEKV